MLTMYNLAFYFIYRVIARKDDDTVFTSVLGVFIIIGLHIISILQVLHHFGLFSFPRFSRIYLYNKLYWCIPCSVVLAFVFLYYDKAKTKAIIEKYSADEDIYSMGSFLLFLSMILVPVLIFFMT
jgi:hypothetical protein